MRTSHSRMIVERIHRAITRMKRSRRHLPKSAMGRAVDYTLTLWPMPTVYLEDGRIEPERSGDSQPKADRRVSEARQIDNNPVENAIRPTAIGKKNWLFIGEAEAGQRSAILFTIIDTCRNQTPPNDL